MELKTYITNITKRAKTTIGFLRRNLRHCTFNCSKTAYLALVRSKLEYASVVLDPFHQTYIDRL
ncbi:hypothetical protein DPMN_066023 [Dreissena polymorpha]|uniref:Uncharacterized protein n=1 Tax=Dreissena polymorpha TaxID=45954 RepID=A0A9D3YSQ6_DREPO|nr:hypothetical protein DPMN_066023 [Dreissena polymorpha]